MINLEEIEARAQRHLDSMTVNRDVMARDVLKLAATLKQAKAQLAKAHEQQQTQAGATRTDAGDWLNSAFDDMGIFGEKRK
jgi:hypothetical protein